MDAVEAVKLGLAVGGPVAGVVGGWFTMRSQLADARREAGEANAEASRLCEQLTTLERLHGERLVRLEADRDNLNRRLDESVKRLSEDVNALRGEVHGLNTRIDRLLTALSAREAV